MKILSRDHQDDAPTTSDCEPNVGPLKIPNISVIYPTDPDSLPEPIENYEFDWAGFHHENDEKDFDEEYQRLEKRNKYHPSGDFEKGYLKHVHLYPPSCACQTKVSPFICLCFYLIRTSYSHSIAYLTWVTTPFPSIC